MAANPPVKQAEWLTTDQAARLSGLSQSLVMALLDWPCFDVQAIKTEQGHRQVNAVDFQRWVQAHPMPTDLPTTLADVRSGVHIDEDDHTPESPSEKQRRADSMALARSMGLF